MQILSSTGRFASLLTLLVPLLCNSPAWGQLIVPYVPELDDIPKNVFSYGSFIDSAVPMSTARLRVDAAYNNFRPDRGEFLTAPEKQGRRSGFPLVETKLDYQEIHAYGEYAFSPWVSLFLDAPNRFVNPAINQNHEGPGDVQAGVKYLFFQQSDLTASLQLRAYAPTGQVRKGLGSGHPSVEPAVLWLYQCDPTWRVEGEVNVWVPINDAKFGSEIVRYGLGTSYGERTPDAVWVTPVAEIQGWSLVRGKQSIYLSNTRSRVTGGAGTIVNGNLGVRVGYGLLGDFYFGYSRALTGDDWYRDLWRCEFRYFF